LIRLAPRNLRELYAKGTGKTITGGAGLGQDPVTSTSAAIVSSTPVWVQILEVVIGAAAMLMPIVSANKGDFDPNYFDPNTMNPNLDLPGETGGNGSGFSFSTPLIIGGGLLAYLLFRKK